MLRLRSSYRVMISDWDGIERIINVSMPLNDRPKVGQECSYGIVLRVIESNPNEVE